MLKVVPVSPPIGFVAARRGQNEVWSSLNGRRYRSSCNRCRWSRTGPPQRLHDKRDLRPLEARPDLVLPRLSSHEPIGGLTGTTFSMDWLRALRLGRAAASSTPSRSYGDGVDRQEGSFDGGGPGPVAGAAPFVPGPGLIPQMS